MIATFFLKEKLQIKWKTTTYMTPSLHKNKISPEVSINMILGWPQFILMGELLAAKIMKTSWSNYKFCFPI